MSLINISNLTFAYEGSYDNVNRKHVKKPRLKPDYTLLVFSPLVNCQKDVYFLSVAKKY